MLHQLLADVRVFLGVADEDGVAGHLRGLFSLLSDEKETNASESD